MKFYVFTDALTGESRSPHGERGLKSDAVLRNCNELGRSPHGERGLKSNRLVWDKWKELSLPPRGAWIEIGNQPWPFTSHNCRSPHGERGLKSASGLSAASRKSRSPHGERGLKLKGGWIVVHPPLSLPPRGAWIEIDSHHDFIKSFTGRSPHGERGLKLDIKIGPKLISDSRSPHGERGLKSERKTKKSLHAVAPPTGSVD